MGLTYKYKKGNKVKVKKDLSLDGNYGISINPDMIDFKGKTVTISKRDTNYSLASAYYIKEDGGEWVWTEDMFEIESKEEEMKTDYKFGDIVTVRSGLIDNNTYGMNYTKRYEKKYDKYIGKKLYIVRADSDLSYLLSEEPGGARIGDGWYFTPDMIEPYKEKAEEVQEVRVVERFSDNEEIKEINRTLKQMARAMDKTSLYEEQVKKEMLNMVKEVSVKEVAESLHSEINEYIKNTFGVLPKVIKIENNETTKEIKGLFHNKFENILKIIEKNVPLMLTGPAGAGKNHTLEQVAEALDLPFYFTNAVTQEYKLTGFIDANGVYQETQFYKAFKDGGLFFLDEIDASCPESLIVLNSAIANGYFDFPNGRVNVNDKFRVVCAGNTFGTGADMIYVGRNALDGATLDRFTTIQFDYDEDIERQLAYDNELFEFIKALRKAIQESSLRYIVSMRATINATKLLEIGMDKKEILESVIIKNMQIDDLNTIINKINNSSEWKRKLEEIKNARN